MALDHLDPTASRDITFWFNYDVLKARMGALSDKVFPYIRKTWEQIAKWALEEVKIYTPATHTGTDLRSMWILESDTEGEIHEFIIRNTYPDPNIILWFEEGTKPHEIPVGQCGFLHFFTYEGDEVYTKRSVWHPGTVAWRMAAQTVNEAQVKIDQYMAATFTMVDQMLDEAAAAAGGKK